MIKSRKFQFFLAVVVLVVGYAVYDYQSRSNAEKVRSAQGRLIKYPADQISSFSIRTPNSEIELKKDQDGWKLTKPLTDYADERVSEEFAAGLVTESSIETAVEGDSINWSNFGLDQPKGTILIVNNQGEKTQIQVGQLKNFQGDAFLRKNDENKVIIASSTWFAKLEKTPLDFRDKRLMRMSTGPAYEIHFVKGAQKFTLEKKEDQWILPSHPDWTLDQNKVRELLLMLNTTEVVEVVADGNGKDTELKQWGLDKPRLQLTVELRDKKPWVASFALGSDKVHRVKVNQPEMILKVSPIDSDKLQQMTEDSFRDRSEPFQFHPEDVREVEIKLGAQSGSFKADNEKAKSLITSLSKLKVQDFQKADQSGLNQEILLKGDKGEVFRLQWKSSKTGIVAKTSQSKYSFTLHAEEINNLKLDDFFKKESSK